MPDSVLLVASERDLRDRLDTAFSRAGWNTHYTGDAQTGALVLSRLRVDVVVAICLTTPPSTCVRLLRAASSIPLLVVTDDERYEDDVREAFEAGADEITALPTSLDLLVVRTGALLRRGGVPTPVEGTPLRNGPITLDPRSRQVTVRGTSVRLTRTEFELLTILMANSHRVVTRAELIAEIWGEWFGDDHTVEVHLSRLRRKILDAGGPRVAESLPGVGYRLGATA